MGNDGKYNQLSAEACGKIEAYRSLNCAISKIAGLINHSKSTVWEEIKRGKYICSEAKRQLSCLRPHALWLDVTHAALLFWYYSLRFRS